MAGIESKVSSSNGKLTSGTVGGAVTLKGLQYGLNYPMSKRTVAYYHAGTTTITDDSSNSQAKVKGYGIGIHHSF